MQKILHFSSAFTDFLLRFAGNYAIMNLYVLKK